MMGKTRLFFLFLSFGLSEYVSIRCNMLNVSRNDAKSEEAFKSSCVFINLLCLFTMLLVRMFIILNLIFLINK